METTAPTARFLRPLAAIYEDFSRPIPSDALATKRVQTKKGGAYEATYCNHATLRDLLDERAPGWEWATRLYSLDGLLYVQGTLTVVGTDGRVSRDGTGNEDADLDGYGDPSSNAEAQALRRAAMAHGLGRELWRKDGKPPTGQRPAQRREPDRTDPRRPVARHEAAQTRRSERPPTAPRVDDSAPVTADEAQALAAELDINGWTEASTAELLRVIGANAGRPVERLADLPAGLYRKALAWAASAEKRAACEEAAARRAEAAPAP